VINGLTHSGIDNACHIGGLIGGFAMGWLLARPLESEARMEEARGLIRGICVALVALLVLSWPLAHPSPEVLSKRQFRKSLIPFATAESKAQKLTADLNKL
jgi:rhomboid protease GluP